MTAHRPMKLEDKVIWGAAVVATACLVLALAAMVILR